jgi:Nucleotidyltransferase
MPGDDVSRAEILARTALLDALEALGAHRDAVVLIGAQAIYLQTGGAPVALAPYTKDTDLAIDVRALGDDPRIEEAMAAAGFVLDPVANQPGSWTSPGGVPVDLMVPQALSGGGGHRGARIPPHSKKAARRAVGLEASVVDRWIMRIAAFDLTDGRSFDISVAGPAALLVSKLHKISERRENPRRLVDKDAHDVYRLLVACPTPDLADTLARLRIDDLAGPVTIQAIGFLQELFGDSPDALGAVMAGRAETGVGLPDTVAASASALAADLHAALRE